MARTRIGGDPRSQGGFTLLELLIALVLLTVIATFSVSAYFGRSEVTLENAVRLLVEDLRMAQTRATYFASPVEVVFELDGSGYELRELISADTPSSLGPPVPARRFGVGAVFEGIRIERVELSERDRLVFDARGVLLAGGTIVLSDGDETRTIELQEKTGRIRLPETSMLWDSLGH